MVLFSHILAPCVIIVVEHRIKRVKRGKVDYKWKKKQPLKQKKKKPLKHKKKKKLKPYKSKKVSPKKRKKKVIHRCAYSYSSFFAVLTFLNLTINVTIGKKKNHICLYSILVISTQCYSMLLNVTVMIAD